MEGTLSLTQEATKNGIHARAIHNALPTAIPFGHHAFPKRTNIYGIQALTKQPNQNRPNGTPDPLGHAVSKELIFFARAHHIERAVSFARAHHIEKATLPPGQFPGESEVPFCKTSLAGDPLPLRFFLHSRFSASLFRQNGMAVGFSLWWRLPVPRARTQPRSTHHHSVWPPSDNEPPTHFRTRQP